MTLFLLSSAQFGSGIIIPTPIIISDIHGTVLEAVFIGEQVVVSRTISTNFDTPLQAMSIFDIRNSDNVSVSIAWQRSIVAPKSNVSMGISWIPEEAIDYTIRAFLVSNLTNPQVLSEVSEYEVRVREA